MDRTDSVTPTGPTISRLISLARYAPLCVHLCSRHTLHKLKEETEKEEERRKSITGQPRKFDVHKIHEVLGAT